MVECLEHHEPNISENYLICHTFFTYLELKGQKEEEKTRTPERNERERERDGQTEKEREYVCV